MTQKEFLSQALSHLQHRHRFGISRVKAVKAHRAAVEIALKNGQFVPANILEVYHLTVPENLRKSGLSN